MLQGKKILLGVCGSIAAYKSALIVRLLIKEGAEVKVIMTTSASSFITPLTLSTLSNQAVEIDFVQGDSVTWTNHVHLGMWANHFLIAPASANTIAKFANGICDNLLAAVYLSARCPVSIAPAMDLDMWEHPTVRHNLAQLKSYGNHVIEPGTGELASGLNGKGRMAEPEELLEYLRHCFSHSNKLVGKNILITAGPTYEPLDPVRFIGNRSSGKMGYSLALQAKALGATVFLISGPTYLQVPAVDYFVKVETAQEMYDAVESRFDRADILIFAAAVADYRPKEIRTNKIKKSENGLNLELQKTVDIAAEMGKRKKPGQYFVGFALETEHEMANAEKKLRSKNMDLVVLNSTRDAGATFGYDTNKITILQKNGKVSEFPLKGKTEVATDILETLLQIIHA